MCKYIFTDTYILSYWKLNILCYVLADLSRCAFECARWQVHLQIYIMTLYSACRTCDDCTGHILKSLFRLLISEDTEVIEVWKAFLRLHYWLLLIQVAPINYIYYAPVCFLSRLRCVPQIMESRPAQQQLEPGSGSLVTRTSRCSTRLNTPWGFLKTPQLEQGSSQSEQVIKM